MTRNITCRITPSDANATLLDFLARRFNYLPRDAWLERIRAGRLRVNDLPAKPDLLLVAGAALCHDVSDIPEPPVDTRMEILHDTPEFLVINKPGNLPIHPAGRYFNNTLWALLKREHNIPNPVFVNRLDRETSGLCLVARDPETAARLNALFAARRVRKTYLAIVHGRFPDTLDASGFLEPDPTSCIRKKLRFIPKNSVAAREDARPPCSIIEVKTLRLEGERPREPQQEGFRKNLALSPQPLALSKTLFRCLDFNASENLSFIEAEPVTGRTHQIRATLCSLGFPILGDKLYGLDETLFLRFNQDSLTPADRALLRLPRQALHAHTLDLPFDPPLHLCAPLPLNGAQAFLPVPHETTHRQECLCSVLACLQAHS